MSATIKPRAPTSKTALGRTMAGRDAVRPTPTEVKRLLKSIDTKMDRLEKNLDRMLAKQTKGGR